MATVDDYREASVPTSNELVRLAEAAERARWEKVVAGLVEALEGLISTSFVQDQKRYVDRGIGTATHGGRAIVAATAALAAARELLARDGR